MLSAGKIKRARSHRIKQSFGDITFDVVNSVLLLAALLLVLYPLIYVLSSSFSSTRAVTSGRVTLWPVEPTLYSYSIAMQYTKIWNGYLNSFFYMTVGTVVGVLMTILASYPLSRKKLRARKVFSWIFLFTMLFSGGLIPTFLVVKALGLLDSVWAIALPGAVSAWNIIIMRTFFQNSIPEELYESAELDGCSEFGMLVRIAIPLSGAIIAVIALFFAVWLWNSYYSSLIYISSGNKFPLQIILRDILVLNKADPTLMSNIEAYRAKQGLVDVLKYVLIVIASVPLLVVYPFVQRFFVKGVMIGSIKG